MSIPAAMIVARLRDLDIEPLVKPDGQFVLRAQRSNITSYIEQLVRENRDAIIDYLKHQPFEDQLRTVFREGFTITMQPVGTTLKDHLDQIRETQVSANGWGLREPKIEKRKPNWTDEEWEAACALQDRRVREYEERIGKR